MTNFERLTRAKSVEQFWSEVKELNEHKLSPYIDYPAFLKSEDPNLMHFVKAIGEAKLLPSETEMIMNHCKSEADRLLYQQLHQRSVLILEKTTMFCEPYYVVCNKLGTEILKTHEKNVTQVQLYEDIKH